MDWRRQHGKERGIALKDDELAMFWELRGRWMSLRWHQSFGTDRSASRRSGTTNLG
jgi:hypothetical protein